MEVRFIRGATRRYRSVFRRADGVEVEFDGGGYNKVGGGELPHDLAHLIVEDELGLERGVWGVMAAGGMFGHAKVVAGRRKPHAGARGRAIVAESSEAVMQAEVIVRAVCDVAQTGDRGVLRRNVGERYRSASVTGEAVDRAIERLRQAAADWAALAAGEELVYTYRRS